MKTELSRVLGKKEKRRILAILTTKGGEGKTTLAINIATCLSRKGFKVLVVDTDPQSSLTAWYKHGKGAAPFDVTHITDSNELEHLRNVPEEYDYVVVDGAATLNATSVSVIVSADMVLVPVKPSPISFSASSAIMELVDIRHKRGVLPVRYVMTMTLNRARLNTVLRASIKLHGYKVLQTQMRSRQAYPSSLAEGGTIFSDNTTSGRLAQGEIENITREVLEVMNEQ